MKKIVICHQSGGAAIYMCEGGRKEKGGKGQYVPSRTLKKKLALCLKIGSLNRRSKGMEVPRFLLSKRAARAPARFTSQKAR